MNKVVDEKSMTRILVRFLTRFPFSRDARPAAALLLYEFGPREIIGRILRLRARLGGSGRGLQSPRGYLINDGTVLAAELLRELPPRPLGTWSFAPFEQEADSVLEIVTDVSRPQLDWEFVLDGVPVDDALRPALALVERPLTGPADGPSPSPSPSLSPTNP